MTDHTHTCQHCGETFTSKRADAHFCSTACRKAHHNLRATRGAIIYDFLMETRYNRGADDANEIRNALYSLVAEMRGEDKRERGGRESWNDPRDWIEQNPWLKGREIA